MKRSVMIGLAAVGIVALTALAISAEREENEREGGAAGMQGPVAPVDNPQYAEECGSCHFAYPPGLLPARSWEKLMGDLSNHFGDNAELSPEVTSALTTWLTTNAGDRYTAGRPLRMARSIPAGETPLRITRVPYFVREHRGIPARMVTGNPAVKSLSQCDACHTRVASGSFHEGDVRIPGFGAWDD